MSFGFLLRYCSAVKVAAPVLARAAPARGMAGAQQVIELSNYLEARISGAAGESAAAYAEVGKVISVGDGIARVYGLANVQAGEMVVFDSGYVRSEKDHDRDSSLVYLTNVA